MAPSLLPSAVCTRPSNPCGGARAALATPMLTIVDTQSLERRQYLHPMRPPADVVEARIDDVARKKLQGMTEVQEQRIEDRFFKQPGQLCAVLRTVARHSEEIRGNSKAVAGMTGASSSCSDGGGSSSAA